MHELFGFVVLLVVLGVGFGVVAVALRGFARHEDEQAHRRRLRELDARPTQEQRAADRQAVERWAEAELQRRRGRGRQ